MYFVALTCVMAVASTPAFRWADAPPNDKPARVSTLDGLRGILALSVYFQHASLTRHFVLTGRWELGTTRFYDAIGAGGVAMFFMITGYLFWGKVLKERGRLDFPQLLLGRFFRIGPTYAVALFAVLVCVIVATGWSLHVPVSWLVREIAEWSVLGVGREVPINNDPTTWMVLVGVTWSLRWEWGFYLSLPILALLLSTPIRSRAAAILSVPLIVLVTHLTWQPAPNLLIGFAVGVFCATLRRPKRTNLINIFFSLGALVAITVAVSLPSFHTPNGYIRVLPILLLGAAFFFISSGGSIFGLLTSRAAKRLGDISYPVYLLQGLVLLPLRTTLTGQRLMTESPTAYWCVVVFGAIMLACFANLVHGFVERPGIALGRSVIARFWRTHFQPHPSSSASV